MEDNFWIFLLLLGFTFGLVVVVVIDYFDASDGEINIGSQRFVRVSAEQEEQWCEEWVCEESVPVIGEEIFGCSPGDCYWIGDNEIINGKRYEVRYECVSESLVRRRC